MQEIAKDTDRKEGDEVSYKEEDLVRVAKREHNNKRSYLVLNPLQAKHMPCSPGRALGMFDLLAKQIKERYIGETLLLIGFAETATAIGAQAAITLGARYIQTTREVIPEAEYLFFSEEHSHATEQKLVKNDMDAVIDAVDRIVFVEDEVTTGKTILNIIAVLEQTYHRKIHFSVASLLNGMTPEHMRLYREARIDVLYLLKTNHSGYDRIAEKYVYDGTCYTAKTEKTNPDYEVWADGYRNARRVIEGQAYEKACDTLWHAVAHNIGRIESERILVVGTEEFMFPALYIGRQLERWGNVVKSHSTTRSPIAVSCDKRYPVHQRYALRSLYDHRRITFLYDIARYDRVLIVTDACASDEQGLFSLLHALRTHNTNIGIVRWSEP